jgi:hypothetical protein
MEDRVLFEIAKLLKAKGFEQEYYPCFAIDGKIHTAAYFSHSFPNAESYFSPTIGKVLMWIYENHNIWIQAHYSYNDPKPFCWVIVKTEEIESDQNCWLSGFDTPNMDGFDTPNEAYSDAILYCLNNLIK